MLWLHFRFRNRVGSFCIWQDYFKREGEVKAKVEIKIGNGRNGGMSGQWKRQCPPGRNGWGPLALVERRNKTVLWDRLVLLPSFHFKYMNTPTTLSVRYKKDVKLEISSAARLKHNTACWWLSQGGSRQCGIHSFSFSSADGQAFGWFASLYYPWLNGWLQLIWFKFSSV